MSSCLWRVVVGMALFGFVATLKVPAVVAKEPTAITDQTKSFEGPDRDAARKVAYWHRAMPSELSAWA